MTVRLHFPSSKDMWKRGPTTKTEYSLASRREPVFLSWCSLCSRCYILIQFSTPNILCVICRSLKQFANLPFAVEYCLRSGKQPQSVSSHCLWQSSSGSRGLVSRSREVITVKAPERVLITFEVCMCFPDEHHVSS